MLNEVVAAARGQAIPGGASPLIGLSVALVERGEPAQPEIIAWTLSGPSDNGSLSVPLQVADLRAMVRADEDALSLVSYALAAECRASANGGWRERRFGSAQPPDGQEIEKRLAGYQWLDSTDRAGGLLRNNRDVLLYGEDGSGKTTAATLLGSRWAGGSHGLVWLDLIDPADRDESVAYALLGMPRVQSVLVVVENVEANPAAAREVFALIRRLHSQLGVPIVILATGSQAVARQDFQLGWATVLADGRALVDAILRDDKAEGMPAEQKAQVRERAAGDAVIAKLAIGLWHEHGGILSEAGEFADLAAASLGADALGAASRVLLYKLACLSLFEIQIDQREIAPAEQAALDELLAAGMVHPNDEAYSIGPRSLGRLLVQHAQRAWADALALDPPDRVAYR